MPGRPSAQGEAWVASWTPPLRASAQEGDSLLTLIYYGHCAFLWTSPQGVRVLIDSFGNSPEDHWFLRPFPTVEADVALVTHDHFDHNAVQDLPGSPTLLRGPGELSLGDVTVRGVRELHAGSWGSAGMSNTIFVIESEGVRFCHIGDNRHDLPGEVRKQLGDVDVLMVTVDDSCHLLTYQQVAGVVELVSPRVVAPMHYYIEGLTTESSTLMPPDGWLATRSRVKRLSPGTVEITREDLPDKREVWVFSPTSIP